MMPIIKNLYDSRSDDYCNLSSIKLEELSVPMESDVDRDIEADLHRLESRKSQLSQIEIKSLEEVPSSKVAKEEVKITVRRRVARERGVIDFVKKESKDVILGVTVFAFALSLAFNIMQALGVLNFKR